MQKPSITTVDKYNLPSVTKIDVFVAIATILVNSYCYLQTVPHECHILDHI